jgi:hypothetical protein
MTCLFNARAYRDGSAAAPRRPDTSYWVLGCRGLVREHLVPHVQGAGLLRRGTTCQGVPTAIAPLKDLENLQSIHFSCSLRARGWVLGWVRGGSSAAPLGSNWRWVASHIDFGVRKIVLFPTEVRQHWPLLVLCTSDLELYSIDSGRSKLFGHTDSDYGPAIKQIEALVRSAQQQPSDLLGHTGSCTSAFEGDPAAQRG